MDNRIDRDLETREETEQVKAWTPPTLLPDPNPEEGYVFHWIRLSTEGQNDPTNISSKLREGWVPVKADDHPELKTHLVSNEDLRYKDNVVMGGLMLCKAPKELVEQRTAFYRNQTKSQMEAVDNNLMRESDSRMPIYNKRSSETTFGKGN
jgi:hypothetical protein